MSDLSEPTVHVSNVANAEQVRCDRCKDKTPRNIEVTRDLESEAALILCLPCSRAVALEITKALL